MKIQGPKLPVLYGYQTTEGQWRLQLDPMAFFELITQYMEALLERFDMKLNLVLNDESMNEIKRRNRKEEVCILKKFCK